MTDKQQVSTEHMNEVIMQFDGWKIHPYLTDSKFYMKEGVPEYRKAAGMKYHSSWSELMPVISKIQKLGFDVVINAEGENGLNQTFCYCDMIKKGNDGDKYIVDGYSEKENIVAVFNSVYQFIQWYNKNKIL